MIITGFEKNTLLDYPGKVSALIFTFGCNLRCPYCHNPELVIGRIQNLKKYTTEQILDFLKARVGLLDALSITGGEPTIHSDLIDFIKKVKELGFLVKLDTNGLTPSRVKQIIDENVVDYWAMDIKGNEEIYKKCGFRNDAIENLRMSINLIMNANTDYEFRTTSLKTWHTDKIFNEIGYMIKGAKKYYIQNFRNGKTLDKILDCRFSFNEEELGTIKTQMEKYAEFVGVRS